MKKRANLFIVLLVIFSAAFSPCFGTDSGNRSGQKITGEPDAALLNINRFSVWVQADGRCGRNPLPQSNWGAFYPPGTAGVVFADGIIWGGVVKDGHLPEIRVGGQRYKAGTVPGRIILRGVAENPADPSVRVWRIRPDWQTADLTRDAAEYFHLAADSVTQDQIDAVRAQYETDWGDWPWQKGAPFYDSNGNGVMDEGEEPGIAHADQIVWFVANDLDSAVTINFYPDSSGSPPIGLEMQVTLWAYNRTGSEMNDAFRNLIFKRVRLIYKGRSDTPDTARIDSMFIGQWVDPDVGYYADDLAGCDTSLQVGYCYNSTPDDREYEKFGMSAPAVGYVLLQGPVVASGESSHQAFFNFLTKDGFKNLVLSSFSVKPTGSTIMDPTNPREMYNLLNGFWTKYDDGPVPFMNADGNPTKFMYNGDPVTQTGPLDGAGKMWSFAPGDRHFQMNSGPFTMALCDTQEVIFAVVGGLGTDLSASVEAMKLYAKYARSWGQTVFTAGLQGGATGMSITTDESLPHNYQLYQNYPNPFNPVTEIRFSLPKTILVTLAVYDALGQKIKTLAVKKMAAGEHSVVWDGRNDTGDLSSSGIYFYRIKAGEFVKIKKMTLLR